MQTPTISVIMPVYNAQDYLKEAIQSILNQTYKDFELLLINDGSTDKSEDIINSFKDQRIHYIRNPHNMGLSPTLNTGLRHVKGKYIARMDADDISHPERFTKQLKFLEENPEYGIVGCLYVVLDEERKPYEIGGMSFETDEEIKLTLFSNNVFLHGETMFRTDLIRKNKLSYNPVYNPCEDYDLWIHLSELTKFAILEDILYYYMINPQSMSGTRWFEMKQMVRRIGREHQKKKGLPQIDNNFLIMLYKNGKRKKDGKIKFNNQFITLYHQLNYQEFIFRTGLMYLKKLNIQGVELLAISFLINPFNWFRKFYRLIFMTHPRLKKKTK